jgi:hypothetical protein
MSYLLFSLLASSHALRPYSEALPYFNKKNISFVFYFKLFTQKLLFRESDRHLCFLSESLNFSIYLWVFICSILQFTFNQVINGQNLSNKSSKHNFLSLCCCYFPISS